MKPTLADYVAKERSEIFQQQETIEKISKLFSDLKGFYEQIDIEKADELTSLNVKQHKDNGQSKPSQCASSAQSAPVVLSSSAKLASDKDNEITQPPEDALLRLMANRVPRNKIKSDSYRVELLKQIEEKKKQKQLEIERDKVAEQELEKKIAQQRLAMYLDWMEERKRGDFIGKPKQLESDSSARAFANGVGTGGERRSESVKLLKANSSTSHTPSLAKDTATEAMRKHSQPPAPPPVEVPGKDLNILANLSEVRQIMHHDHIEMLEKLLELRVK